MPMSRLLAGTLLTSWPPTETLPDVASSRPARIRSAGVFPQPAEQRNELAGLDVQGEPVERLDAAVLARQVVEFDRDSVCHSGTPVGKGAVASRAWVRRRPRVTRDRTSSRTKPNSSTARDAATDVGPSVLPIWTIWTCSV